MLSVTDLRAGTAFQVGGTPYVVLKYTHIKMGRGGATIRLEARDLKTGAVATLTFNSGQKVESTQLAKRKLQYLYQDKQTAVFMDPATFEQVEIAKQVIGDQTAFLREGGQVDVLFHNDQALSVQLPAKVTLTVAQAEPGVKGDSASNMYKGATLENGLKVKVPLFVNKGNKVAVDTRTGEYVERVKQ